MRFLISLSVIFATVANMAHVSAQDETLVTPQPEHKLLERLAGQWEYTKLSIAAEGTEPNSLGTGTISANMLGHFFVVSHWTGTLYEMDYKAVQVLGYNSGEKKYSGAWVDSFMSYRWELVGDVDEKTDELVLESSGPGPTGGTMSFRERYQFPSADSITIIGEIKQGNHWISFSTTKLTRKK